MLRRYRPSTTLPCDERDAEGVARDGAGRQEGVGTAWDAEGVARGGVGRQEGVGTAWDAVGDDRGRVGRQGRGGNGVGWRWGRPGLGWRGRGWRRRETRVAAGLGAAQG